VQPVRRRGAALENALLEAAWEELGEKGYDAFTIESVAARARTSRAVVYRRWPSKPDLVMAAIGHSGFRLRVDVPDTGSLRDDMIDLLRSANRERAALGILMSARLGAFYAETGRSFADLRQTYVSGRTTALDRLLDRAVERGEVDPARLTPRVRGVAFDLYRHELLMTNRPVADEVIESIVDEVFMPLVRPSGS
jgi:AcrR family transcriptional regulator